jgi:hypothetical protein
MRPTPGDLVDGGDISRMRAGARRDPAKIRRRLQAARCSFDDVLRQRGLPLGRSCGFARGLTKRVEAALGQVGLEGVGAKYPARSPAACASGRPSRGTGDRARDRSSTSRRPGSTRSCHTIHHLILNLQPALPFTAVVVSHGFRIWIADTVAMLHEGRIVEVGPPAAIQSSTNPIVRRFIKGEPDNSEER